MAADGADKISPCIGAHRRFLFFYVYVRAANGPAIFAGPLLRGISKSHSKAKSAVNEFPQHPVRGNRFFAWRLKSCRPGGQTAGPKSQSKAAGPDRPKDTDPNSSNRGRQAVSRSEAAPAQQ